MVTNFFLLILIVLWCLGAGETIGSTELEVWDLCVRVIPLDCPKQVAMIRYKVPLFLVAPMI